MPRHELPENYTKDNINRTVLNEVYLGILLLTLPMLITSYLRLPVMGYTPIISVIAFGPVILSLLYLFRDRVSYAVGSWAVVTITYIIGVVDIISLGLFSMGLILFFVSCISAAMFLDKRKSIIVEIINAFTFFILSIMVVTKQFSYDFNFNTFFYSYEAWAAQLTGFVLLMLTLVFGIRKIQQFNDKFIEELSTKNDELVANAMQLKVMDSELQSKYNELVKSKTDVSYGESKYRTLFNNLNDFVYSVDLDGRFLAVNETFLKTLHIDEDYILGKSLYDIIPNPDHDKHWDNVIERVIKTKAKVIEFNTFKDPTGKVHTYEVTLSPQLIDEKVESILGTSHDVTDLLDKDNTIKRLAYQDPLTRLNNRVAFKEFVTAKIKDFTIGTYPFAFILMDLDNFKKINDSIGHANGDAILTEIGTRLPLALPNAEIISRMGGDEFALVVHIHELPEDIEETVGKIQGIFDMPFIIDKVDYSLSSSMGISVYPYDGKTYEDLLKNVDSALYEAKRNGRNDYRLFDYDLKEEISKRIHMERYLEKALDRDEIHVHYQPQFNMNKQVKKFEALMRWTSPEFGLVGPDTFIPLLEDTGLIVHYGNWILREALLTLKKFNDEGYIDLVMAVNISPVQFRSVTFVQSVADLLQDLDIEPKYLELEITENVLIDDFTNVLESLNALSAIGVNIALDDFGTGFSSLSYLRTLPIKVLKIDKSFVQEINQASDKDLIIGSLIQLAHNLNLEVVAEGIESKDQQDYLLNCGCNLQQGFYHARPNESQKILEILKTL